MFKDSYGVDKLTRYLFVVGLLFSFSRYTLPLGSVFVIYGTFRAISKNKYKRYQELALFQNFILKIEQKFYSYKASAQQRKNFKIFTCPTCSQKLRVPRKKGKVTISCKKCGNEFKGRS
jgi:hypothetical protein